MKSQSFSEVHSGVFAHHEALPLREHAVCAQYRGTFANHATDELALARTKPFIAMFSLASASSLGHPRRRPSSYSTVSRLSIRPGTSILVSSPEEARYSKARDISTLCQDRKPLRSSSRMWAYPDSQGPIHAKCPICPSRASQAGFLPDHLRRWVRSIDHRKGWPFVWSAAS